MKDKEVTKYLELIQGVISRLAQNSFLIKGWTLTISLGGLSIFLTSKREFLILLLVVVSTLIFWILDGYYLKNEKLFRELYEDTAKNYRSNNRKSFSMDTSKYKNRIPNILLIMLSFPTYLIYISIILLTGLISFYFK